MNNPLTHEYWMRYALKEALLALEEEELPIGAIITTGDKIIARGYNQVQKLNDCTAHAEMIALTSAFNYLGSKYLSKATLYVTIEPCLMCAGALYWSKINQIVYGCKDEKNGFSRYNTFPFHPKTNLVSQILEEECKTLIQSFFQQKREI
ncbi:MAG: nucleoside deaminase [Chitinophagaceae bacterium]